MASPPIRPGRPRTEKSSEANWCSPTLGGLGTRRDDEARRPAGTGSAGELPGVRSAAQPMRPSTRTASRVTAVAKVVTHAR
jgi:hypothetical protein